MKTTGILLFLILFIINSKAQPCLVKFDSLKLKTGIGTCNSKEFQYYLNNPNHNGFYWDYGDGNNCTCVKPKNFYTKNGIYTVKGIVYDANMCADTIKLEVEINCANPCDLSLIGIPVADTLSYSCNEFEFNMISSSNAKKATWYFGDGNSTTDKFYVHTYNANGTYNAKALVEDSIGCKDSIEFQININCTFENACKFKIDNLDTTAHQDCLKKWVSFSSNNVHKTVFYKINQGNYFQGNKNQLITFNDTGKNTICCIAIDSNNCADTICKTFGIYCPKSNTNSIFESIKNTRIYPNPAKEYLTVETTQNLNIEIYDINGKIVYSNTIKKNENIDIKDLTNGLYWLKINDIFYNYLVKY